MNKTLYYSLKSLYFDEVERLKGTKDFNGLLVFLAQIHDEKSKGIKYQPLAESLAETMKLAEKEGKESIYLQAYRTELTREISHKFAELFSEDAREVETILLKV